MPVKLSEMLLGGEQSSGEDDSPRWKERGARTGISGMVFKHLGTHHHYIQAALGASAAPPTPWDPVTLHPSVSPPS